MAFELRVAEGQYILGAKVGSGSFGVIHEGRHVVTGEIVAVKLEKANTKYPQLLYEYKIYKNLKGNVGVSFVKWYGKEGDFNILVMQMLGPSLEDLFNYCDRRFHLKTVCILADQMLQRIERIHAHYFIHRDIKPDNFLIGLNENFNIVYVIDFGLAKRYILPKTREHIPFIKGKSLTGTARYASVNTHLGYEQARRDDLETLGYVLLYFMKRGKLPWQGLRAKTKQAKYSRIAAEKQKTSVEDLCEGLPREFFQYLKYCRELEFTDKPDYQYLRNLFRGLFLRKQYIDDGQYEWTLKAIKACGIPFENVRLPIHLQMQSERLQRNHSGSSNGNHYQPFHEQTQQTQKMQTKYINYNNDYEHGGHTTSPQRRARVQRANGVESHMEHNNTTKHSATEMKRMLNNNMDNNGGIISNGMQTVTVSKNGNAYMTKDNGADIEEGSDRENYTNKSPKRHRKQDARKHIRPQKIISGEEDDNDNNI